MNWLWTKLFWGLLLLPLIVLIAGRSSGDTDLSWRVGVFIVLWMLSVILLMRCFRIWPFDEGKDA